MGAAAFSLPCGDFHVAYLLASTQIPRSAAERDIVIATRLEIGDFSGGFPTELRGSTHGLDANTPRIPPLTHIPSQLFPIYIYTPPYILTQSPLSPSFTPPSHPTHPHLTNSTDPHSPPPSSSPSSPSPTDRTSPPHCPSARPHTISPRPAPP